MNINYSTLLYIVEYKQLLILVVYFIQVKRYILSCIIYHCPSGLNVLKVFYDYNKKRRFFFNIHFKLVIFLLNFLCERKSSEIKHEKIYTKIPWRRKNFYSIKTCSVWEINIFRTRISEGYQSSFMYNTVICYQKYNIITKL